MDTDASPLTLLVLLFGAALLALAAYGVVLLSRLARGMNDLQDQVDDLQTRMGALDPGETRVAEARGGAGETAPNAGQARSPDETLPGSGGN